MTSLQKRADLFDSKIKHKDIVRISEYIDLNSKTDFKCNKCEYVWNTRPNILLDKQAKCPNCKKYIRRSNIKKYTNESLDLLIKDRNLIRLGDYVGIKSNIDFGCKKCNYVWKTSPNSIINSKTNCPKCANILPITNEIIDLKLNGRNIQRIGNIINSRTKIEFKCLKCNKNFMYQPSTRLLSKDNCNRCSKTFKLTNEEIDLRLKSKNMKRVSDYIVGEKIEFNCFTCNKNWKTYAGKIFQRNHGCQHCFTEVKYTNEHVDLAIFKKQIKRIDDVINSKVKITFNCLTCDNTWKVAPVTLVLSKVGCPHCSIRRNEKLIKETLQRSSMTFFHNFGIKKIDKESKNLFIDFYFPELKLALEYNGAQHYRPVKFGGISIERAEDNFIKQKERDNYLSQFCKDNDIELVCIDGREYEDDKLQAYMNEFILIKQSY